SAEFSSTGSAGHRTLDRAKGVSTMFYAMRHRRVVVRAGSPREDRAVARRRGRRGYRPGLEGFEDRCLLNADFSLIKADLPALFKGLQAGGTAQMLSDSVPLVGSALKNAAGAQFVTSLQNSLEPKLPSGATTTAKDVQDVLFNTLNALGLFASGEGENQAVVVDQTDPNDGTFTLHLQQQPSLLAGSFQ